MRRVAPLLPVALAALAVAPEAHAGGIAPIVMGGFHTERVTIYSSASESGERIPNVVDYRPFDTQQLIGNVGGGLELMLGDRDERIQGVFRGFYMLDAAQTDPATYQDLVDPETLVVNYRENVRHLGVGTVGLNVGIVSAANDKFKLSGAIHLGAAFATADQAEFFLGQAGLNLGYLVARRAEVFLDVAYGLRIPKELSHGAYGTAGVRILFN
jgi:hypothetical protein